MKKILLSLTIIISFIIYSGYVKTTVVPSGPTNISTGIPTELPVVNPTAKPSNERYKDGSYTGDNISFLYGNFQVKALISVEKITKVDFLQYPNDRRTSVEINTQAIPILESEAIHAQSANVDIVSGATDSSKAFIESLSSALIKAH